MIRIDWRIAIKSEATRLAERQAEDFQRLYCPGQTLFDESMRRVNGPA